MMGCSVYPAHAKKAGQWAMAKADIQGESRETVRDSVEKRMKKAALHVQ